MVVSDLQNLGGKCSKGFWFVFAFKLKKCAHGRRIFSVPRYKPHPQTSRVRHPTSKGRISGPCSFAKFPPRNTPSGVPRESSSRKIIFEISRRTALRITRRGKK